LAIARDTYNGDQERDRVRSACSIFEQKEPWTEPPRETSDGWVAPVETEATGDLRSTNDRLSFLVGSFVELREKARAYLKRLFKKYLAIALS
jgi:hypothetical protein